MFRLYTKPNPEIEEIKIKDKAKIVEDSPDLNQTEIKVHSSYIKSDAFQYAKAYIVIFSGGTTREKDYFKLLSDAEKFPRFKLEFLPEARFNQGGEPRIFDYAYQKVSLYKSSETEEYPDSYYIISDVDHFYPHLVGNKEKCQQLGIKLMISNPCFEVWLYYSKHADKFWGFMPPEDLLKLSKAVKGWYNKDGKIQTTMAVLDIEQNIENAKMNYCENCDNLPDLYSTNMYVFASEILPYIKKEIDNLIENNRISREKFCNT